MGAAVVTLNRADTSVAVDLAMTGLAPGEEHASHIHGFSNDVPSLLPNFRLDRDGDGFVEDQEGEAVVGPVIFGLTRDGSTTNASLAADFLVAGAAGNLHLRQAYDFDTADPVENELFGELVDRLTGREVQVHGLFVPATQGEGTPNEVNGVAGYKPGLPVANGILLPVGVGRGRGPRPRRRHPVAGKGGGERARADRLGADRGAGAGGLLGIGADPRVSRKARPRAGPRRRLWRSTVFRVPNGAHPAVPAICSTAGCNASVTYAVS